MKSDTFGRLRVPEKIQDGFIYFSKSRDFDADKSLTSEIEKKIGGRIKDGCREYHITCDLTESGVVNFYRRDNFYDIYFCRLLDVDIPLSNKKGYNYIIECDSCGLKGSELKEKEEFVLSKLGPKQRQRFILFEQQNILKKKFKNNSRYEIL